MKIADAFVEIRAEGDRGRRDARDTARAMADEATRTFAQFFSARVFVDQIGEAIGAASDLNESINAIHKTFGPVADDVLEIGENAATSLGLSQRAFNELAVRFSSFAKTIAGPGGDVAGVLDDLTGRASDFASVMNIDVAEAASLFQSGLAGETEPLRRFGLDLSAAAVQAHALEEGIIESDRAMTEAEKVQARYSLLMEQTADVAGDFADTSDGLANKTRIVEAAWEDARAKLGTALLPVMEQAVGLALQLIEVFDGLPQPVQLAVVGLLGFAAVAAPIARVARAFGGLTTVVTKLGAAGGPLAAIAVTIGVVGYALDLFGTKHVNAGAHIDTTSDALLRASETVYGEATAIDDSIDQVEALALAHQALSLAITDAADDQLTEALARFNVPASETLDVLQSLRDDGAGAAAELQLLQDGLHLSADEAQYFIDNARGFGRTEEELQAVADALGITVEEVGSANNALDVLDQVAQENQGEFDALARAFLDTQSRLGGVRTEALAAAEEIAGSRFEAGNAVDVYEEYNRQLAEMGESSVLAGGATAELGDAAGDAAGGLDRARETLAGLGIEGEAADEILTRLQGNSSDVGIALYQMAEGAGIGQESLQLLKTAVEIAAAQGIPLAEAFGVARESMGALGALVPAVTEEMIDTGEAMLEVVKQSEGADDAVGKQIRTQAEYEASLKAAGGEAIKMAGTGKDLGDQLDETGKAATGAADDVTELAEVSSGTTRELDETANAASDLRNAFDRLLNPAADLREAERRVWEEAENLTAALDENGRSFESNTEAGRANQVALQANADAIIGHGVAMVGMGESAEDAAADIASNTRRLKDQLREAGLTEAQINDLIEEYGLMPDQVDTTLQLFGEQQANRTIDRYNRLLDKIPASERTEIQALIDQGKYDEANRRLDAIEDRSLDVPIDVRVRSVPRLSTFNGQVTYDYGGGQVALAHGAYIGRPMWPALLGEDGAEAVLPLTNPSRIRQLWADERISGPITEALAGDRSGGSGPAMSTGVGAGIQIGTLNVGERRDIARIGDALGDALFLSRFG